MSKNKEKISRLSELKNIGEVSEKWLNSIDVYTKEDIKKLGPVIIYNILKSKGYNVSVILLYALQGAMMDLHWKEVSEKIKKELRNEAFSNKFDII